MPDRYGYPPLDQQRCKTCHYCVYWDATYHCHRHPPVTRTPLEVGFWPSVRPTAWCGHWAPQQGQS